MMACPNCGKALIRKEEDYYRTLFYCPNCGAGLLFERSLGLNTSNDVLSFPYLWK